MPQEQDTAQSLSPKIIIHKVETLQKKNHVDFLHTFVLEYDDAQSQNPPKFISSVVQMNLSYIVRQIHGTCSIFLSVHPLEEPHSSDQCRFQHKFRQQVTKTIQINPFRPQMKAKSNQIKLNYVRLIYPIPFYR